MERPTPDALMELWKQQMAEAPQTWARFIGQTPPPLLATAEGLAQWKKSADEVLQGWSRALEQVMQTDAFAATLGQTLEQWLVQQAPLRKAVTESAENLVSALGLPSRAQLAALSRQQMELEDRIEALEERLERGFTALTARLDEIRELLAERAPGSPGTSPPPGGASPETAP